MHTIIRHPELSDESAFLAAVKRSKSLHEPWVSPPCSRADFRRYLKRMDEPANFSFVICERATEELVGVISITNIVFGAFCSGYLEYYVFAGFERQGLMQEGMKSVIRHAFKSVKLHRLEANIQPGNTASIALVKSCGFKSEGYSPRYLKIRGRWRDHERWAILSS